jgi:hypothetical protein
VVTVCTAPSGECSLYSLAALKPSVLRELCKNSKLSAVFNQKSELQLKEQLKEQLNEQLKQQNTAEHIATQHNTAQHSTTQHNTAQYSTIQHNTAQHSTTQHNTAQHNTAVDMSSETFSSA